MLKECVPPSGDKQADPEPAVSDTSLSRTSQRTPVPRGIARSGPALLSYGFRPFFLLAGCFALVAMAGWIGALVLGWPVGGDYGAANWHAHEMLFGYAGAALAGFMLTAIPNWTGRLPVSGTPLLLLVLLWLVGRVAMAAPAPLPPLAAAGLDALFLPALALIAAREILAGKNWKNLKILVGLVLLSAANIAFHVGVLSEGQAPAAAHFAVGALVTLIALVGGRIIPSFTRNWLVRNGSARLPRPFSRFDLVAIAALVPAFVAWACFEPTSVGAALAFLAAGLNAMRLWRWVGWRTMREPLLLVMHVAYAAIPFGLTIVGLSELGLLSDVAALHVLTVGCIGLMTLAVMTRASLGHTGRPLIASRRCSIAYLALGISAVARPLAELVPGQYALLLDIAGGAWMLAFALFLAEYGPILVTRRPAAR